MSNYGVRRVALALTALIAGLPPLRAQAMLDAKVETTVTLGGLIVYVMPGPQPLAFVTVGTNVTLLAMEDAPAGSVVQWYGPTGGQGGPAEGRMSDDTLCLDLGIVAKTGTFSYQAYVTFPDGTRAGRAVDLVVTEHPVRRSQLLNSSVRVRISRDTPLAIAGFVFEDVPLPLGIRRHGVLVRAVGRTLADFGIAEPLADPQVEIYRTDGSRFEPPVEVMWVDPMRNPAHVAMLVGAFPLREGNNDYAYVASLEPGAYTMHVTSASGGEGEVLVEVYEIPGP